MKKQSISQFRILRALSVLFLTVLALGVLCIGAGAQEEPSAAKTWNLSASAQDSVFASAYESASSTPAEPRYELRVFGSGAAKDFALGGNFEGYPIVSVTVENGVTSVGAHTFEGEQWLQRVSLAPSVLTGGVSSSHGTSFSQAVRSREAPRRPASARAVYLWILRIGSLLLLNKVLIS